MSCPTMNELESRKTNDESQRHKINPMLHFTLTQTHSCASVDKVIGQATMFVSSTNHCTAGNSMQ